MTCHSGGTLEIYVEPYLAKPLLVLVGHGPVIETLATLGRAAGLLGRVARRRRLARGDAWSALALTDARRWSSPPTRNPTRTRSSTCCGREAGYVSLVASRRGPRSSSSA